MNNKENINLASTGEALAAQYVVNLGYRIIAQNYHSSYGEIDIIAQEKNEIVIIEVKARTKHILKDVENSISKSKQKKITLTALYFLSNNPHYSKLNCRFDVIILFYYQKDETFQIQHFKNAFNPLLPFE
jgi:putative endonuclease